MKVLVERACDRCGKCRHMTNIEPDERDSEFPVMGGCFVSGEFVASDMPACAEFDEFIDDNK